MEAVLIDLKEFGFHPKVKVLLRIKENRSTKDWCSLCEKKLIYRKKYPATEVIYLYTKPTSLWWGLYCSDKCRKNDLTRLKEWLDKAEK